MAKWAVEVEAADVVDEETYFLAQRRPTPAAPYLFAATNGAGESMWASKPGIANHYAGSEKFRAYLRENDKLVAVKVPADADKRWKSRRIRRKGG